MMTLTVQMICAIVVAIGALITASYSYIASQVSKAVKEEQEQQGKAIAELRSEIGALETRMQRAAKHVTDAFELSVAKEQSQISEHLRAALSVLAG